MAGGDPTVRLVVTTEEQGAKDAAAEQERLRAELLANKTELEALRAAHRNFKGTQVATSEEAKRLKANMDAKREAIAQAQVKIMQTGGSLENLFKREQATRLETARNSDGFRALRSELSRLSPEAANMASKAGMMSMGLLGVAAAAVALVVGTAALTASVASATSRIAAFGIAAGDAARNERLMLEGMVRARGGFGGSERMAIGLQTAINRVARDVPLARSEVAQLFDSLPHRLKRSGDAAEKMLRGMALAKSVGQNFWALGMNTNMAGKSMLDLAREAERRFGPVVAKQMLSVTVQTTKLREAMRNLFAGVDTAPLGLMIKSITDQLRETSVVGYSLKQALSTVFNAFSDDATRATPLIQVVMEEITVGILTAAVAGLKLRNSIKQWIDEHDVTKTNGFKYALDLVVVGLVAVGAAAATAAISVGVLLAAGALLAAPFVALVEGIKAAKAAWDPKDWGKGIVVGIAEGIKGGFGFVVDAISGLGSAVKAAFKAVFKISSPSRVMFELGEQLPEGAAGGVRAGAPKVQRSIAEMVVAPRVGAMSAPGVSAAAGASITIGPITIEAPAGAKAQELAAFVRLELERAVEQACKMLGINPGEVRLA